MADKHRILQIEGAPDFNNVVRVTLKVRIFVTVISRQVSTARADMIEQDYSKIGLESLRNTRPHILVATEAMRKNHGAHAFAGDLHIVALQNHGRSISRAGWSRYRNERIDPRG